MKNNHFKMVKIWIFMLRSICTSDYALTHWNGDLKRCENFGDTTFTIMTFSTTTISINDTHQNNTLYWLELCWALCWLLRFIHCYAECYYAKCCYAECRGATTWFYYLLVISLSFFLKILMLWVWLLCWLVFLCWIVLLCWLVLC